MKVSLSIDFDNGGSHHSNITVEDNKVSINAYQQHSSSTPRDNTYKLAGNDEQTLLTKDEAASYVENYIQRVLNEAFDITPATFQTTVER